MTARDAAAAEQTADGVERGLQRAERVDGRRRLPGPVLPLLLVLLSAALASGAVDAECPTPEAAPAPVPVFARPDLECGYYEGGRRWAYYGNCTGTWVLVTVDAAHFPDRSFLVPPGEAHNLLHASAARGVYDVRSC